MADENIGNLVVEITGDYSELQGQLDQAATAAEASAKTIADAFDKPMGDEMVASLESLNNATVDAGQASAEAAGSLEQLGGAAASVASPIEDVATSTEHASAAAHEGHDQFDALGEKLLEFGAILGIATGFEELAHEAVTAFATVQSVTVGLTQLTGSAEQAGEAIAKIKEMAASEPFSFPEIAPTAQRLVALGVAVEDLPRVLQTAADAASATGNSFDTVANALGRIEVTGQVSARQLVSLGVSWQNLADTMGVTIEQAQELMKKNGQTAAEDMEAVLATINSKFAGATQAQAETVAGEWKIFKNQWEEAMVAIGDASEPVIRKVIDGFGNAVDRVKELGTAISDLATRFPVLSDVAMGILKAIEIAFRAVGDAVTLVASGLEVISGNFDKARQMQERFHDSEGQLVVTSTKLGPSLKEVGDAATTAGEASGKAAGQHDVHATAMANLAKAAGVAKDSLEGLTQAQKEADDAFSRALKTYEQAAQGFQDGSVSADVLDRAVKNLVSTGKAAGESFDDITAKLPAVTDDFVKCADASTTLEDAQVGLKDALGDGFIVMDKAGEQTVQFVGEMQNATDVTDNYSVAVENGVTVLRGLDEGLQTANDDLEANAVALADAANAAWDLAAAQKDLAFSADDAATAEDNLGAATTRASGKGGGGGGNMSAISFFEDVASAYSNPLAAANNAMPFSAVLDAAKAAGLVWLGGMDFVTQAEYDKMTAGSKQAAANYASSKFHDAYGNPIAEASSSAAASASSSVSSASTPLSASDLLTQPMQLLSTNATSAATGTTTLASATNTAAATITSASQQIASASTNVATAGGTVAALTKAIVEVVAPGIVGAGGTVAGPSLGAPITPGPMILGSGGRVGEVLSTSGVGTGVHLNINVTGNTVNGTQGMNDLSNRIADTIVTRLRTVAGLKL